MKLIHRTITFFRTLRGQLILTYTTVTVLALLALELTVMLLVVLISGGFNNDVSPYLGDVVTVLPAQARAYLQPDDPDPKGLQSWLQATYDAGYASLARQDLFDSPAAPIVKSDPMYVIAADKTVLAAAPASAQGLVGRTYSPPADVNNSAAILDNALRLDLTTANLYSKKSDGNYWMAVPVQQNEGTGPLAGVIVVTVKPPSILSSHWWPLILVILLGTGFVLLMAVAPFGALFGFIMSRGLTRRLKVLTQAVDAWSEGDFSVQPQDHSKDEISYLGMRMRRMAEHVQTLLQTRQELALLEERNRLARELHDTVKQETFATLMQVRAAKNLLDQDPAAAREHLEQAEELIKSSQQELGLLITELRPAALDSADAGGGPGLAGALKRYLESWSQHSRIPAELQVQNEHRLPLEIEQTLFRVAQEALSNVARHSRASAVNIHLAFDSDRVTLSITDNGVGFEPCVSSPGFGLQSMRERMTTIHGTLRIESAPETSTANDTCPGLCPGGTTVTASAPTRRQEENQK
jgi:NarL family two-component system sensor histidine kinase LiaS